MFCIPFFYDTKSFILNIYEQKFFINVYNVAENVSCGVKKKRERNLDVHIVLILTTDE